MRYRLQQSTYVLEYMSSLMRLLPLDEKKLSEEIVFSRKNRSGTVETTVENNEESELVLFAPLPDKIKNSSVSASKGTKRKAN